jgi:hypothetical protein
MKAMTVHRPENGLLYSTTGILTAYDNGLHYSLIPQQQPQPHHQAVGAGNHVPYLLDGHQEQHLHPHLPPNESHPTITVNPMAVALDQPLPPIGAGDETTCPERKKTFYILISLIVLGISVMVITVITAIVIFAKCEFLLLLPPLSFTQTSEYHVS